LPPHFVDKILRLLASAECPRAILISDYDKGVCHQGLAESVVGFGRERGIPVLVDPAPGGEFEPYLGASLVTPNRHEAQRATGKVIACPQQALEIGQELCRRLRLNAALIKLDKDGMALAYPQGAGRVFPTRARQICDVTGAGDMVLAVLGLCRASGVDLEEAVELANAAAGLEVERFGATPLARSELYHEISTGGRSANKIVSQEELLDLVALRRRSGQTVVFTNGCFDLLHPGHLSSLEQGAELGDCLVVALNDDESAERLKGPGRPVLSQEDRAAMVAALGCVDLVTVFDEPDPCTLLALLRPDVLFKGGDYPLEAVVGKELVESYGGRVFVTQATVDASSTKLIGRIRQMAFVS
jgi:D-beta-D-heptose 7-phosphate kinase/D-beta-D-heptose 1-phosphate adenosyltransferase